MKKLLLILLILFSNQAFSCSEEKGEVSLIYRPSFLPIKISVSENGVSASTSKRIVTPIGEFSLEYKNDIYSAPKCLTIIVINLNTDKKTIYEVTNNKKIKYENNGRTKIDITPSLVTITVFEGDSFSLELIDKRSYKGYSIQIIATKSKSKAYRISKKMINEGYLSFVNKIVVDNRSIYRVRIGVYLNLSSAQKFRKKIKKRYSHNVYIKKCIVAKLAKSFDLEKITSKNIRGIKALSSLGNAVLIKNENLNNFHKTNKLKYAIQIFATKNRAYAESLTLGLRHLGYESYIVDLVKNGKNIFRVRVGNTNDKKSIVSLRNQLKHDFNHSKIGVNSTLVFNNKIS